MSDLTTKPSNPKDLIGSNKLPLHLWPATATLHGCLALLDGALKYGRSNFRAIGVRSTIYADAGERHFRAYLEGQTVDPDSGLHPLAHALACAAIILDAEAAGVLVDDRNYPGGYHELVKALTPHVSRLKTLHAGKSPKHYTIKDVPGAPPVQRVVVGVMARRDGRVFLQRRALTDETFPGMWEFPGGGIEPGEGTAEAVTREFREELGIRLSGIVMTPIWSGAIDGYGGRRFEFEFLHVVPARRSKPRALDGQPDFEWMKLERVRGLYMTPANILALPAIERFVAGLTGRA